MGPTFTLGHRLIDGSFSDKFKKVQWTFVGGGSGTTAIEDSQVLIRFTSQEPERITANTQFVSISGKIRGFDEQPECTIDFVLNAIRRP
jgi:hypothetical protein